MSKPIEASVSSLVDLKAELFRKQEQQKGSKRSQNGVPLYVKGADSISNIFKADRKKQDFEKEARRDRIDRLQDELREEEETLRKSAQALKNKTLIYDRMHSGQIKEDETVDSDARYLVDFEAKQRLADEQNDEHMVEYTDALGRTRTCHKDKLSKYAALDHKLSMPSSSKETGPELVSADMQRDAVRQQWEHDVADAKSADPVHYQHVLRDEQWEHGVGYYQFSGDEQKRKEQMDELKNMTVQTEEARQRTQSIMLKRKIKMEQRLAKVRQRKDMRIENGEQEDNGLPSDDETIPQTSESVPNLGQIPLPNEDYVGSLLKDTLTKAKRENHIRPWDKGKATTGRLKSYHEWLDKSRNERDDDFAPPEYNY